MMKTVSTTAPITFEEFERLDFGADHVELLEGELIRLPPAQKTHGMICKRLFRRLDDDVEALRERDPSPEIGAVYFEMGYLLRKNPRSWLQPDISITRADQVGEKYFEGAPLIVFEIASKFDLAIDIDRKVEAYLANGAEEVWVFYPETGHALVHTKSSVRREARAISSPLLPGIEIPFEAFL